MTATTPTPWSDADWRSRAGNVVLDRHDPHGEPIITPIDRRWLWRIETDLVVSATTDTMRQLGRDLGQYLRETCEHHWTEYRRTDPADWMESHRQCLWCSQVEPLPEDGAAPTDGAAG